MEPVLCLLPGSFSRAKLLFLTECIYQQGKAKFIRESHILLLTELKPSELERWLTG